MTNRGMLSIVQHRDFEEVLLVRARAKSALEELFPKATIVEMANADYRWRAPVRKAEVQEVLCDLVEEIDYDNFKNSVQDPELLRAYSQVWTIMQRYQTRLSGPSYDVSQVLMDLDQHASAVETYHPGWPIGDRDFNHDDDDDQAEIEVAK